MKRHLVSITFSLLVGIAMLFLPLLRDFHFESAFVATLIGSFWSSISLSKTKKASSDIFAGIRILSFVLIIGIPPFLFSLFSGCLTFDGFAFWLLLPLPSVFLGAAVGRFYRKLSFSSPALLSILTLSFCGLGVFLFEFLTLPQVYFFNHVWGTWPGPIYDETLQVGKNLVFFRWITFLWIVLLWTLPSWNKNIQNQIIVVIAGLVLMLSYFNLDTMGIITTRDSLKEQLSLHKQTEHFDIYFEEESFTQEEVDYWATRHEFHFNQIVQFLDIEWPKDRKIESFVYANAWQKKKLVGAKFTSYVPIWLEQDQLHIAKQHLEDVLKHELVHAISKQFGNDLFNGSWSIGMIEGVAEAIAGNTSSESTLDQIIATEQPYPSSQEMKSALSNSGFYSSASAISYTTAGSFVEFLLANYPVKNFKEAYPNNDFEDAYPKPFEQLVTEWHQHLDSVSIDSVDQQISEFIFSRRSLFQKECPHVFSEDFELWDTYNFHLSNQDSSKALQTINKLYELDPSNKLVKRDWLQRQLLHGSYSTALYAFDQTDTLLTLQMLKADALFLSGSIDDASDLLQELKPRLDTTDARNFKYSYQLRSDSTQWSYFMNNRYKNTLPQQKGYSDLNLPNLMLSISKSIELRKQEQLLYSSFYSSMAFQQELSEDWFNIYEQLIDALVFLREFDEADLWINALSKVDLRDRYQERLTELKEWRVFVQQYSLQLRN
ncbi:MAG: hypothetical protein JXR20_09120 [Balneola sp.]